MALALPLLWFVATTDLGDRPALVLVLVGALATWGWLVQVAFRSHRAGRFLPNRCETCEKPMRFLKPGTLKAPGGQGTPPAYKWCCTRCGRLA
ncbi:MAG: hypothetical protein KC635_17960 [Myxococcales bacterium]|nr:hypothetical protein [Myxococcales bacterium]MCB9733311.1 hypothetical protein [Deltaproteobacteria bacterium]